MPIHTHPEKRGAALTTAAAITPTARPIRMPLKPAKAANLRVTLSYGCRHTAWHLG